MPLSDAHRAELHAECLDRQAFIRECEREREGAAGDRRAAAAYDAQIVEARDRIGEIDFLLDADQDERRDIPGPKPLLLALWDSSGWGMMSVGRRLRVWAIAAGVMLLVLLIFASVVLIDQII